ncbi:MAG: S-methyl-5-thioribose-1-phosphate isomerase [Fibrobacter sp.]|nr:S-methyl-5-thioribose-1-phosphate isomerase [Fibrobacter sp.]
MSRLKTIEWIDGSVRIIDQTRLPMELVYEDVGSIQQMYDAIKVLKVRGAPAIGIAAAFGLYLGMKDFTEKGSIGNFLETLDKKADFLAESRPTAVNLFWAIKRVQNQAKKLAAHSDITINDLKNSLLQEALNVLEEDRLTGKAIGEAGVKILKGKKNILTHCNAGGLATAEYGTALAPIYLGTENGLNFHVYADETRPLLQGARITTFELMKAGIPVTLICDNMSAVVMAKGEIDAVIVGADRIAANGDTANKIGTYGLALIAKAHNVPFYVAAPFSTFDLSLESGNLIPIEERDASEIICGFGKQTAPAETNVFNPAFDVTPSSLIDAFITEKGIIFPPYSININAAFNS